MWAQVRLGPPGYSLRIWPHEASFRSLDGQIRREYPRGCVRALLGAFCEDALDEVGCRLYG